MNIYDRFLASTVKDIKDPNFYKALVGEMLGVMFLVFVGCNSPYGSVQFDHARVALCFGLGVATLVWFLANISGGHINPAVSAGMFVTRKISLIRFVLYVVFQCIGGVIGAAIMKALTCEWQVTYADVVLGLGKVECTLGYNQLGTGITPGQGCVIELLITFVLVTTVFATCDGSRSDLKGSGPLAIGLSVAMCHLAFIGMTGSSMNSARSFGPAAVGGFWDNQWVYWVGPVLGGILAGLIYEFIFAGDASMSKLSGWLADPDYGQEEEENTSTTSPSYEMKRGSNGNA